MIGFRRPPTAPIDPTPDTGLHPLPGLRDVRIAPSTDLQRPGLENLRGHLRGDPLAGLAGDPGSIRHSFLQAVYRIYWQHSFCEIISTDCWIEIGPAAWRHQAARAASLRCGGALFQPLWL